MTTDNAPAEAKAPASEPVQAPPQQGRNLWVTPEKPEDVDLCNWIEDVVEGKVPPTDPHSEHHFARIITLRRAHAESQNRLVQAQQNVQNANNLLRASQEELARIHGSVVERVETMRLLHTEHVAKSQAAPAADEKKGKLVPPTKLASRRKAR